MSNRERSFFCPECAKWAIYQCADCKESCFPEDVYKDVLSHTGKRIDVCENCGDKPEYKNCVDCNQMFHDPGHPHPEHSAELYEYCPKCRSDLFQCSKCNEVMSNDYLHDPSLLICEGCHEAELERLEEERLLAEEMESQWGEFERDSYDPESEDYDSQNPIFKNPLIYPPTYSPLPINRGKGLRLSVRNQAILYLGDINKTVSDILDKLNDSPDVKDSQEPFAFVRYRPKLTSIADDYDQSKYDGFEIVTHPATIDIQKERWSKILTGKDSDFIKTETAFRPSLEISIRRDQLSPLTISKMITFVNSPDNRDFIEGMLGSGDYQFIDHPKRTQIFHSDPEDVVSVSDGHEVRFRFFKSTLDPQKFNRNLEFVHALSSFCSYYEHDFSDMTLDAFDKFVALNNVRYPALEEYIERMTKD